MNASPIRASWVRWSSLLGLGLLLVVGLGFQQGTPSAAAAVDFRSASEAAPDCSLLDRPEAVSIMMGLEQKLMALCGRLNDQGLTVDRLSPSLVLSSRSPEGVDVQQNNHLPDPNPRFHQDESDLAVGGASGNVICSAYNDSATSALNSYMGFSRSTDGGATWTDRGPFSDSYGDPAVVYRKADGFFYAASLGLSGLRLYRSTDLCQTFPFQNLIHSGGSDDKEMMRVDNNTASPFYGRLYVCWTNFNVGGAPIQATWSSNGGVNWSAAATVGTGSNVQGCWPAVASNGDVYVVFIQGYTSGTNTIRMARSTNGGVSWAATTNVATSIAEAGNLQACGNSGTRPTMNGNIRTWAMPQVAVGTNGWVHVTYTRRDAPDRGNIYYQRSTDNGSTWSAPVRINNDTTTNDQWHSTIAINDGGTVVISWYDRRGAGAGNLLFRRYAALSSDNGTTWGPNIMVSDVDSVMPPLLPNFDPSIRDCYMGDYDAVAIDGTQAYIQWSDNRNPQGALAGQPDMFFDRIALQADVVDIVLARYDQSLTRLRVAASSSLAPNCSLTLVVPGVGQFPMVYLPSFNLYAQQRTLATPPATVTVNSSCGGTDTAPVQIVPRDEGW
jgi:hypothetical protein